MMDKIFLVILTTLLPVSELRGGIPLGLSFGLNPLFVLVLSILSNAAVFFPLHFGMDFFYRIFLSRIGLFNKYLERMRIKGKRYLDRYGMLGLIIFVAIPLPAMGAYTASFVSWLFDLEWKRSFLAIFLGVAIAGMIVLGISLGAMNFLNFI